MCIREALENIKPGHPSLAKWEVALAAADIYNLADLEGAMEHDWVDFLSSIASPVFKSALQSLRPVKVITLCIMHDDRCDYRHHHFAHYAL